MSLKEVKSVRDLAIQETLEEMNKESVERYKRKLKEVFEAKKVVKNLERELEDLEEEITQHQKDIQA